MSTEYTTTHGNAINDFSLKLHDYNKADKSQSWVMSPASIMFCLGMFYKGCTSQTEKELASLFRVDKHKLFDQLIYLSKALSKTLTVTNGIYINDQCKDCIKKSYTDMLAHLGTLQTIDCTKPEVEANKINKFVSEKTKGLIDEIISADCIDIDTLMIILNTVYFKCEWQKKFNPNKTIKGYMFTSGPAEKKPVDMMTMTGGTFMYFENKDNQVVEMPYKSPAADADGLPTSYVMGVVLPKISEPTLIQPTMPDIESFRANLCKTKITKLQIPKFKSESCYELKDVMKSFGLQKMFNDADIDDLMDCSVLKRKVHVSKIIHKAVVIVDEEGTEASGATAMTMAMACAARQEPVINFIADHPFLYYIRETTTNTVLFTGAFL